MCETRLLGPHVKLQPPARNGFHMNAEDPQARARSFLPEYGHRTCCTQGQGGKPTPRGTVLSLCLKLMALWMVVRSKTRKTSRRQGLSFRCAVLMAFPSLLEWPASSTCRFFRDQSMLGGRQRKRGDDLGSFQESVLAGEGFAVLASFDQAGEGSLTEALCDVSCFGVFVFRCGGPGSFRRISMSLRSCCL